MKEIYTKIMGISYNQLNLKDCIEKDYLKLVRDNTNSYDSNAVKVLTKDNKLLGFINKKINPYLAQDLDKGIEFNCQIVKITGIDKETLGCNILISEKKQILDPETEKAIKLLQEKGILPKDFKIQK